MRVFTGLAAAPGVRVESVRVYDPATGPAAPPGDPATELARLERAIAAVHATIADHEAALRAEGQLESAAMLAIHRLALADPTLRERAAAIAVERQCTAAEAIIAAAEEQAADLESLGDACLSAHAAAVRDVARQVWRILSGTQSLAAYLDAPAVIAARDLGPADLVGAPRNRLRGIALAMGGVDAHASIVARSLGIPAVVGLGEEFLQAAAAATKIALDGDTGMVILDPSASEAAQFHTRQIRADGRVTIRPIVTDGPTHTRDGQPIRVSAIVASIEEARIARQAGAEAIGLLRSEWLFLDRPTLPDEEEQYALYMAVAAEIAGMPLVVRTLDVGGDKTFPALPLPREANPFLGQRGIRVSLSRPAIFLTQLRALLRAGAAADVRILLPMISSVAEVRRTRALLEQARDLLIAAGLPCAAAMQLGVMIETPAAALHAERLAREADFFSIGANDLTQYTLACDRGSPYVAALYQPLDPAVLRLIRMTCEAAQRHGRSVAVCGEVTGDPQITPLLIGLGVNEVSCVPSALAAVRAAVCATDSRVARDMAERALAAEGPEQVRTMLSAIV